MQRDALAHFLRSLSSSGLYEYTIKHFCTETMYSAVLESKVVIEVGICVQLHKSSNNRIRFVPVTKGMDTHAS